MERGKIYDLTERIERWSSPTNISGVTLSVSSNGKLRITMEGLTKTFSFIDSIRVLDTIVNDFKSAGYKVF